MTRSAIFASSTGLCVASPLMFGWWSIPFLLLAPLFARAWYLEGLSS